MKKTTEDTPIWEIIQHEFINLSKESVAKKEFSEMILSKYPHIKKGTLSAQIAIQIINKRARTGYFQCGKERVCGDNKFDFLFEQEDKTLCKYDKLKHGTWEIYKRDDGKLDVRIISNPSVDHTKAEGDNEENLSKEITIEMMVEEYTGKGTYTSSEGAIYAGEWKDGNMHGKGTLTLPTGDKIEGVWKNGRQNGQGILTYSSGDIYVGEFKDDIKNGQGKMTYSSGKKYVGEFKDGNYNGQGILIQADGGSYVGEFKDGNYNGQGTYTLDGTSFIKGLFINGVMEEETFELLDALQVKSIAERLEEVLLANTDERIAKFMEPEKKLVEDMKHPNYNDWSDEIKTHYDKIRNKIKKHGHVIQGTVDGKDALERPFAYTIGASFKTGAELLCFFPIKGEGLSVITGIINRILDAVKKGDLSLDSQILNDNHIYYLPIAMLVLEEEIKQDTESVWPRQLERDGFLAEFSTNDHKLILLICTDKNGNFPWDEKCESYWPQLCPPPLVAMAQEQLTGDDSLLCKLEDSLDINKNKSETIVTEGDPTKSSMQDYGFKGNGPENPNVPQLITFLYIGVAKLNDGHLSDNEILKMVEKHESYGVENKKAIEFITEAHAWWDDSVKKDVYFDDLVQCAKLLKNTEGWSEELKETIHMDLTSITTADGLVDLKDGKFIGERKLKVVSMIIKLFEND